MTPTESQRAELAAEITKNVEATAVEWAGVPELLEFTTTIPTPQYSAEHEKVIMVDHIYTFDALVDEYAQIKADMEKLDVRTKLLREAMQTGLMLSGKDKVLCHGPRAAIVTKAGSKKIVPEKLVKLGVSPEVIAEATEIGKPSTYFEVREVKGK
jgi:hypothetical protein